MPKFPFSMEIQSRHTDTFLRSGIVHGGRLLEYCDLAQMEYLNALYQEANITPPSNTVSVYVRTEANWLSPLVLQETAVVSVHTTQMGRSSMVQEYEIRAKEDDRLVAAVVQTWVHVNTDTWRSEAWPEALYAAVVEAEGAGNVELTI